MRSVREQALANRENVYLVRVENGDEHLVYGENQLEETIKILKAWGIVASAFFIRWPGHTPKDMGIFPDEE